MSFAQVALQTIGTAGGATPPPPALARRAFAPKAGVFGAVPHMRSFARPTWGPGFAMGYTTRRIGGGFAPGIGGSLFIPPPERRPPQGKTFYGAYIGAGGHAFPLYTTPGFNPLQAIIDSPGITGLIFGLTMPFMLPWKWALTVGAAVGLGGYIAPPGSWFRRFSIGAGIGGVVVTAWSLYQLYEAIPDIGDVYDWIDRFADAILDMG